MDYNAMTSCETEMKEAFCLCGSHKCRQSFMQFSGAECLHSILRSFGPLMVFRTLIQASQRAKEPQTELCCGRKISLPFTSKYIWSLFP